MEDTVIPNDEYIDSDVIIDDDLHNHLSHLIPPKLKNGNLRSGREKIRSEIRKLRSGK